MFSELHCVADQIDENLSELAFVGPDKSRHILLSLDGKLQLTFLGSKAKQSIQVLQHRMEIEISRLQLHPTGFNLGHLEYIVDQRQQVLATAIDRVQMLALRRSNFRLPQHQLREAEDCVHGS